MSKPAARVGDLAGHAGSIVFGAPTVLIGGMPAARVGDPLVCPGFDGPKPHVMGNIIKGSSNVLIGGSFAARQNDPTGCGIAGKVGMSMPAIMGPPMISDIKYQMDPTLEGEKELPNGLGTATGKMDGPKAEAKYNLGADGSLDASASASVLSAEGKIESTLGTAEGSIDYYKVSTEAHVSQDAFKASAEGTALSAKGRIETSKDQPVYYAAEAEGKLLTAEAKLDVLKGSDGRRTGFYVEAGAEAAVAKGDIAGETGFRIPIPFTNKTFTIGAKAKVGGSVASVGASGYGGVYHDNADGKVHAKVGGSVAAFLGLDFDLEVMFGLEDTTPKSPPNGVGIPMTPGSITIGCPTVLIGDSKANVEAKKIRYDQRLELIKNIRENADKLPPEIKDKALASADRLELNNKAIERARLSNAIYDIPNDDFSAAKINESGSNPTGWKAKDAGFNEESGLAYVVYESEFEDPATPVLVFRGTDNDKQPVKDWKTNGAQATGLETDQYRESVLLGKKMAREKEKYPNGFEVVGHSKAGGQAELVGRATGQKTYTFNAAGVHRNTFKRHKVNPKDGQTASDNSPLVEAFNHEHDILSNIQDTGTPLLKLGLLAGGPLTGAIGASAIASGAGPTAGGNRHTMNSVDENGNKISFSPLKWVDFHNPDHIVNSMEFEKTQDMFTLQAVQQSL